MIELDASILRPCTYDDRYEAAICSDEYEIGWNRPDDIKSTALPAVGKLKATLIYWKFEYVKECENRCGTTTSWCITVWSVKLVLSPQAIKLSVIDNQSTLTRPGNDATALARKAVGEMKAKMGEMNATSSSSQATVAAAWTIDNQVWYSSV